MRAAFPTPSLFRSQEHPRPPSMTPQHLPSPPARAPARPRFVGRFVASLVGSYWAQSKPVRFAHTELGSDRAATVRARGKSKA